MKVFGHGTVGVDLDKEFEVAFGVCVDVLSVGG